MKRTKKNLFCLLLIFTLLFAAGSVSFADSGAAAGVSASPDGTITPMTILFSSIAFTRVSSTKADIDIVASSGLPVDKLTCTITLQEKAFGSSTWTNTSTSFYVEEDIPEIIYYKQINVTNTKNYRIKVVFKEYYGSIIYTTTNYSGGI